MPEKLIAFDFDGTIYDGDSMIDFYKFALRHNPSILIYLPKQLLFILLWKLKILDRTQMKEGFFSYINGIKNIDKLIMDFWLKHIKNIKKFYLYKDHSNELIISASPEFLLLPIANKFHSKKLIASIVDKNNGKFLSKNCFGREKLKRLYEYNKHIIIEEFYTDSLDDMPLIDIAKSTYIVTGDLVKLIKSS